MIVKRCWDDISVEEWIDLEKSKLGNSFYDTKLEVLSILCERDRDEIEDLDISDVNDLIKESRWIDAPIPISREDIDGYTLIDFKKITNGEWIDLDVYVMDYINNFCKIMSILWRKTKVDDWGNVIYEPYKFDIEVRSLEFLYLPITKLYHSLFSFMDWRKGIIEGLSSIIVEDSGDELDEEDKEGLTESDIREIEEDLKREKVKKDFSWIKFIWDLSGEDITKMKDVLDTSFLMTMNTQMMLNVYK
jgi:hypothetical protein